MGSTKLNPAVDLAEKLVGPRLRFSLGPSVTVAFLSLLAVAPLRGLSTVAEDFARATQSLGQRRADVAIPLLESVISRAPGFHPAYREIVDAYAQKSALQLALPYLETLLNDPERNAYGHYALGRVALLQSDWSKALDHFASCVQERPNSVPCYRPLVDMLMLVTGRSATVQVLASRIPGNREGAYTCLAFAWFHFAQRRISEGLLSAQRCLAQAERLSDIDFLVAAHDSMAGAYGSTGADYGLQLKYTLEAARLAVQLDDPETTFSHEMNVCAEYVALARLSEAQECFERGVSKARIEGNRSWLEDALRNSAVAYERSGELDAAAALLSEALDLFQQDDDFNDAAGTLLALGKLHFIKGDLPQSRRFCERALELAHNHALRVQQAYVLRELSKVYSVSGDPILALRHANESIKIFQGLGMNWQAGAGIGNLSEIYAFMGDWSSALRYAQESLRSAQDCEDKLEQQDTLAVIGDVLAGMGRNLQAVASFKQSLTFDSATSSGPFRLSALMGLGRAHLALKEYGYSVSRSREALDLARQLGNRRAEANALALLGRGYRQLGDLRKAREYFGEALEMASQIPLVEVVLEAQRGLAEMALRTGNYRQALDHLESAARTVESLRNRIPTPELKADFGREHAKLFEDLVFTLAQMDSREPGKGWDRKAFDYAERGRARAFLDMLAESRAQISQGLSAVQVQRRNELESALSRALAALMEHDSGASRLAAALAERNLNDWVTAIRASNPQYEALNYPHPADADRAVELATARGAAILEYALGERESYLWLLTSGRLRMFRLQAREEVEHAATAFRKLISNHPGAGQLDAWQAPAEALYTMLLQPTQAYLTPEKPLLIVPDGALHYLPFETLRSKDVAGQPRCLIEQYPMSYMPSVSVLAELERSVSKRDRKFALLAYGDPTFSTTGSADSPSSSLVRGVYESAGNHFPQLPNTRREVEVIGRLFPVGRQTTFVGGDATEASVKRVNLRDYRLVHFATHAVIDDQNAGRSGIVLSLVNTGNEDGILRVSEIFNLEMQADLVVLSACQTGVGTLVRGEGIIGLTRAFLYAGARRVAISLWDVNDLTTPDFMESFYRHLRHGETPAIALRSAKLAMIHNGPRITAHPYFWAPFALEAPPD